MNDGKNKPKDDDWGMTMPHLRWEEKKSEDSEDDFAPEQSKTPSLPPDEWSMTEPNIQIPPPQKSSSEDDWGITQPNFSLPKEPPSDFDKTAPNFNLPQSQPPASDFDKTVPNLNIPRDDWEKTVPNINLSAKDNAEDWGISAPTAPLPEQEEKPDGYWSMPPPVFRVSSGETPDFVQHSKDDSDKTNPNFQDPQNFDKTVPNINLPRQAAEDYGKTIPNVNLRGGESNFRTEPNFQVPPPTPEIAPTTQFRYEEKTAKSSNVKWILLLGGLFFFFVLVIAAIIGAYFLFFNKAVLNSKTAERLKTIRIFYVSSETSTNSDAVAVIGFRSAVSADSLRVRGILQGK